MSESAVLDSVSLPQRVVLLGVLDLDVRGETPAHAVAIRRASNGALDAVAGSVVGRLSEAEVARALNELAAEGLLTSRRRGDSPTGKGRPTYEPDADPDALLDDLAEDDRVAGLVERVRDRA